MTDQTTPTVGKLLNGTEGRDAIHFALAPVTAGDTLLSQLAVKWIETGIWEPLHDALLEAGFPKCAKHIREGICKNRDQKTRSGRSDCFVSALVDFPPKKVEASIPIQ